MADRTSCFVFMDISNLWIAGQYLQEAKMHDAYTNPRFRVDLGTLLGAVTEKYDCSENFLYGPVLPASDSCWSAAWMKLGVNWYHSSCSGGEQELEVAMACDLMEVLYSKANEKSVFILVTGNCGFKPAVERVLKKGVPVEVWSWEHIKSDVYVGLAKTNKLFSIHKLNDIAVKFTYMTYRTRVHRVHPASALVFSDLPRGRHSQDHVSNSVARLMCLFHVTSRDSPSKGTQDLVVEFPEMEMFEVKEKLKRIGLEDYVPYGDYSSTIMAPMEVTDCFECIGLTVSDISPQIYARSLGIASSAVSDSLEEHNFEDSDKGVLVFNLRSQHVRSAEKSEIRCHFGLRCFYGSKCVYQHTDSEKEIFRSSPKDRIRNWKGGICRTSALCPTEQQGMSQSYGDNDSWS